MLPKNLVLDEVAAPKDFESLIELVETDYRVGHEQTTLESISLRPDGTVETPAGVLQVTRDFLESFAAAIVMPLSYAYTVTPELFCENVRQRQAHAAAPITICRAGDVATGLVIDRKSRYRPACTGEVLRSIRRSHDLEFRRASVAFTGVDVEFVRPGIVVEPVVGDVVEIGIAVTNSETGGRQLKASAYSYRLACTNGSMFADTVGVARWPNDPRMTDAACMRAFQREVTSLCCELQSVSGLYEAAIDRPVPDVEFGNTWRRVRYLLPRGGDPDAVLDISKDERRALQDVVRLRDPREAPAMTRWSVFDVHNRITHAAHGQPFRVRRGLQELGGQLLSRAASWPPAVSAN
jgi:hypothetical protein